MLYALGIVLSWQKNALVTINTPYIYIKKEGPGYYPSPIFLDSNQVVKSKLERT